MRCRKEKKIHINQVAERENKREFDSDSVCLFVHLMKKITSDMKLLRFGVNISVLVTFKYHQQCPCNQT